jgi:glycosyltransferase involved in cell wall biosynthesis
MSSSSAVPRVTIGIPTYNRAAALRHALASALAQTASGIEVVVSDNASTDETLAVCEEFARSNPQLRILRAPSNAGPTRNFERVLEAAAGEYFMWLGDDDWLDPGCVAACLEEFRRHPGAAVVASVTTFHDPDGGVVAGQPAREYRQRGALARICRYFATVKDNSGFYGLMRRRDLLAAGLNDVMAGDWLTVSSMLARGDMISASQAQLHRRAGRFGAASGNYHRLVATLGLPRMQGYIPALTIMWNVLRFYATGGSRTGLAAWQRAVLVTVVPGLFLVKGLSNPRFWLRLMGRQPAG